MKRNSECFYPTKSILYNIFLILIFVYTSTKAQPSFKSDIDSLRYKASALSELNMIPKPCLIQLNYGFFNLNSKVKISVLKNNIESNNIANMLSKRIGVLTGLDLKVRPISSTIAKGGKEIHLILNTIQDQKIGNEGYLLEVKPNGIIISANKPAGLFYGMQSFLQILRNEIEKGANAVNLKINIPSVYIEDYPRFSWRGLLLDVAHHFFDKESVKKFIDEMATYKYNILQLHMTNDNAWRIQIKEYPKLTEVGSWRVPRTGEWGKFDQPTPEEKATDGGYYTQEEIKELVKYAQERYVTIVPGIETPGHSLALITSYPSTSCTGLQYEINPGSPRSKSIPYAICVGNENNFEMLDKILTEYAMLFPSKYIHIGGDEVDKEIWKRCPKCQKRMIDENLHNAEELQSYFIRRIENMLISKGKKLVGWDEILEGGLAPEATVMSWRDMEGGIKAAQMDHDVVMSPRQYCYFDHSQTDPKIVGKPINKHLLRLSQVYKFEPIPENVNEKYILGGQGCLWSENIPTFRQNEYMAWPRGMALAEILWSPKGKRDLSEFLSRVEMHFRYLDHDQVNYAKSIFDPIVIPVRSKENEMQVTFSSEVKDLDIFYSFDCTLPDTFSLRYNQLPVSFPKGATEVWARTFRNGKAMGQLLVIDIAELQRRLALK